MQTPAPITATDVADMARHWIGCPPGGYLGSDYGADVKSLLQTPMAAGLANDLIGKALLDIPLLTQLSAGAVNVYAEDVDIDRKRLVFEVAGELVNIGATQ